MERMLHEMKLYPDCSSLDGSSLGRRLLRGLRSGRRDARRILRSKSHGRKAKGGLPEIDRTVDP